MAMKVLDVCKVTPPPESPSNAYLPLTFFDLLWLRAPPVSYLLFYEEPLILASTLVSKLKNSLSITLKHFLPFAGNLEWLPSSHKPMIRYEKGNGISLTVVESHADFYHLSSKNLRESVILHPFVAFLDGSGSQSPLLAVKLTVFPNKGFCVGITVHHATFDGKTFSMFLKTWASLTKSDESLELTAVFDRESVRERFVQLENLYTEVLIEQTRVSQNKWPVWKSEPPSHDRVRGTFIFSGLEVRRLKELATADQEVNQSLHISTFAVTYAYSLLCLVKAKKQVGDKVRVVFPYDCRGRLEPPLSSNYVGNCIGVCSKNFDKEDLLGRDGFLTVLNFIGMSIKGLDNDGALRGAEEWLQNMIKAVVDTNSTIISVLGSSRYEIQSIDFGWGRPRKVDITSIDKVGAFTFTEVGDVGVGKGIEVELSLSKDEMEKFACLFAQGLSKMMKHGLESSINC